MIARRSRLIGILLFLTGVRLLATPRAAAAPHESYHLLKKIVLGGEGGWDLLTLDPGARRLYISRGTHVMVVDVDSYQIVGDIPDTPGVHGIALAPEFGRGFTSNGRTNDVTIFDLKTLEKVGTAKTGEGPDTVLYDPASRRVFTFNARGGSATAIDAETGRVVGALELGGQPEFAVADGAGHLYDNLEDKNAVLEIDSRSLKVLNRWPLAPCESASGLAIDLAPRRRRLFVGCRNRMMAILDAASGKVLATPPIGEGVDANAFDPGTLLAFSSNRDGTLTVVHEDSPDRFTVV